MRDIKFRGKTKTTEGKKWIYGDLLQGCELCDIYEISDCTSFDGSRYEIDRNTVGQYTGLHDKNGKEIYEGDIVNQGSINDANGVIEYKNGQFGINRLGIFWNIYQTQIEVLGNIYDNPELLQ
jgi:uncharacterized phage protein (TIGR01671 family)